MHQRVQFTLRFLGALTVLHGAGSVFSFVAFLLVARPSLMIVSIAFFVCALATALVYQRVQARADEIFNEADARGVTLLKGN